MTTDVNGDYRGVYTYGDERIGVEDLGEIEGKPNNPLYYLYDAIGSMTAITNMNSGVIDSNRFAPYGEPQDPVTKNARHTNSPYGFTGEAHDIEGNLVYLRARYYAPEMMRFIQQDSYLGEIENPLTRNLYIYGNDNPLKYTDPSGHMPIVPALIYLGETALETIPDILLDALIEGNNFKWYKSALSNYGSNLIPGLGEAKTTKKLTKLTQKYGKDIATYFSKHPDDIIRNYKELLDSAEKGFTGIVEFIKKRANKVVKNSKGGVNSLDDITIINKKYAGQTFDLTGDLAKKYPNGVKFTSEGFPDFSPYSNKTVTVKGLQGDTYYDFIKANQAAGYKTTPKGFTWHHVEDGTTMMLVPTDLHGAVRHTGGASLIRKGIRP